MPIKEKNTFILDYSKWVSGSESDDNKKRTGRGNSQFLNTEKNMCVLGQVALQMKGVTKKDIFCKGSPSDIKKLHNTFLCDKGDNNSVDNSAFADKAIKINDADGKTTKQKIKELKAHFKKAGKELIFVNCPDSKTQIKTDKFFNV